MHLSPADIELFAQASRDVNPLHVSTGHAQATPYGQVLAHGVLALVALLDEVELPAARTGRLDVEFRSPVFPGVEYRAEPLPGSRPGAQLRDGTRICLSVTRDSVPGRFVAASTLGADERWAGVHPAADGSQQETPDHRLLPELIEGTAVSGPYAPQRLAEVCRRFPRMSATLDRTTLLALLWSTYLAGMRLPGAQCLLSGLSLRPHQICNDLDGTLNYTGQLLQRDERFGLLTVGGQLSSGAEQVADVEIEALVRTAAPTPTAAAIAEKLAPSTRLSGRSAVIVGGTRGLGAAIALALAGQGCAVYVGHRGGFPAWLPAEAGELAGTIASAPGDASDPAWSAALARKLHGHLDILVCSAAPPIGTLELRAEHLERIESFVSRSLRLVEAPLTGLLPALARGGGQCLVVSSAAVQAPPQPWPHYVAAKAAIEGLTHWAGLQHPGVGFVIARPGLLRTEQTNTPGTGEQAAPVEPVAAALVRQLLMPRAGGEAAARKVLTLTDLPGAVDA